MLYRQVDVQGLTALAEQTEKEGSGANHMAQFQLARMIDRGYVPNVGYTAHEMAILGGAGATLMGVTYAVSSVPYFNYDTRTFLIGGLVLLSLLLIGAIPKWLVARRAVRWYKRAVEHKAVEHGLTNHEDPERRAVEHKAVEHGLTNHEDPERRNERKSPLAFPAAQTGLALCYFQGTYVWIPYSFYFMMSLIDSLTCVVLQLQRASRQFFLNGRHWA